MTSDVEQTHQRGYLGTPRRGEPTISVVTCTFNARRWLPGLIESLRAQDDGSFEWVVADGGSTDGTLDLLSSVDDLNVVVSSQPDFGIYDGLNRAVRISSGNFYLVAGADDTLDPGAIRQFRATVEAVHGDVDIVIASVSFGNSVMRPMKNMGWLYGMRGVASAHSPGMLIRKSLHDEFGRYTNALAICADHLFVKSAINGGARVLRCEFLAGRYAVGGASGQDTLGMLTEMLRVQLQTERFPAFQMLLFVSRVVKNWPLIRRQAGQRLGKVRVAPRGPAPEPHGGPGA